VKLFPFSGAIAPPPPPRLRNNKLISMEMLAGRPRESEKPKKEDCARCEPWKKVLI
jgi:hypothetical protein